MIYFDNAATTFQKPREVYRAVKTAMESMTSPGRGGHDLAFNAAECAFACREKAAALFGMANPENVVFTFNATHGLNIAIRSIVKPEMKVAISGYEHNSVVRPLTALGADIMTATSELFEPEMAAASFERMLDAGAAAVIVNHVSNVFGYVQPVERIAAMCVERSVPFIIDASQSAGCLKLNMDALGADFIAMPGHKGLYGPQGSGLLLCKSAGEPIMHGGSGTNSLLRTMPDFLPDRLEAGTHNMLGIAGLSAGIDFVTMAGERNILAEEKALIGTIAEGLKMIPGVRVFASSYGFAQSGVLSFTVRGKAPEDVAAALNERGIAVRAGLHCAPLAHKSADTLPDGTVRVSVSVFNKKREAYYLLNAVEDIVTKI